MILFATLKKIIFLGKWALYKMIPNFDKMSYVISFMVQMWPPDIGHNSFYQCLGFTSKANF